MYATERQQAIARLLREQGRVAVIELARVFDVTTETVRRDLDQLESAGALRRVHGGAVAPERGSIVEPSLAERLGRGGEAKTAIGLRALDALGAGFRGSVYLDAGTTTAAVAAQLVTTASSRGIACDVVTHSMSIAHDLAGSDDIGLTVIGGRVRGVTAAAVGAETVRAVEGLRPDVAFLGANGLSAAFGASTPDPDEAAVKRAIVRAARRVVLVADVDKFDRELLVSFAPLAALDVIVADEAPSAELAAAASDAGVELWLP